MARRAGIHAARKAATKSTAPAAPIDQGSPGRTWNSSDRKSRDTNQLPSKPPSAPASVHRATFAMTILQIAPGVAPSAIRTPISLVWRVTRNPTTPQIPTAANNTPIVAKIDSNTALNRGRAANFQTR